MRSFILSSVLLLIGSCSGSQRPPDSGTVVADSAVDTGSRPPDAEASTDASLDRPEADSVSQPSSEVGTDGTKAGDVPADRPEADSDDAPTIDTQDGSDAEDGDDPVDVGRPADAGQADGTAVDFNQLVDEIAHAIEASACPGVCPMLTVTASPRPARASSQGQRILLIDDGVVFAAATRYASRTLAYLRRGPDGSYVEDTPSFEMPAEAYDIFKKLDDVWPPVRGSAFNLGQAFADKFYVKLQERLGDTWAGHGSDIQAFLAEMVPAAQFVVSEDQLDPPTPCGALDPSTADAAWAELDATLANMQKTLVSAIIKHRVNYVHLSWGLTHDNLVESFKHDCGGRVPGRDVTSKVLERTIPLFKAMTALTSPGASGQAQPVLLFQAGATAIPIENYLLDCADIPGRIRVMSAPYSGHSVPQGGSHDYTILPTSGAGRDCIDLYAVMGYTGLFDKPREKYFPSLASGLGAVGKQTWPPMPSFANPVALAHFICLSQRYPSEQAPSWTNRLTNSWSKPILDPILYDEFPVETGACVPVDSPEHPLVCSGCGSNQVLPGSGA